jgi:hypothetical protein
MFNTDRMFNVNAKDAAMAGMAVITKLQDYIPEVQVLALALTFREVCESVGLHAGTALTAAGRISEMESQTSPELRALADYIKNEVRL